MKNAKTGCPAKAGGNPDVIVVMLRQPRMHQSWEMRSDPFWEYGSFGLTGCHQRNLMHPAKAHLLNGARLAFVQGGDFGSRLVYLTPPVEAIPMADRTEVKWQVGEMPFTYDAAPIVLGTDGSTDFPGLKAMIAEVRRNGWPGKFASKFRSRREPLAKEVGAQMIALYESRRRSARKGDLAATYEQALPCNPPCVDRKRKATYSRLKTEALAICK